MNRNARLWLAAPGLIVALAAWWFGFRRPSTPEGEIVIEWRGRFRGNARLPAVLNWCPGTRMGLLQGVSRDTGVVLVVYESESLTRGPHPMVSPEIAPNVPRPGATAALRWPRNDSTLVGFRSVSGLLDLRSVGATVSGTFNVRMQVPASSDTLVLSGRFDDVNVTATALGCS